MNSSMKFLSEIRSHGNKFASPCIINNKKEICGKDPINSHNIQKNKILDYLAVDGHVYVLSDYDSTNNSFQLTFRKKGINKTTIFRCLCLEHDTDLFKPIELFNYNGSKEQHLLYALKSLLYEYWKLDYASNFFRTQNIMFNFNTSQLLYNQQLLEKNLNELSDCRSEIDLIVKMLETKDYSKMTSFELILDYPIMFSISQSCCIYTNFNGEKMTRIPNYYPFVHISIFPENDKTIILFTWLKKDNRYYRKFFSELSEMQEDEVLGKLNILLPMYCENTVVSPTLYNSFNPKELNNFTKIFWVNVDDQISTHNGDFCVNNWLGQVKYNMFKTL